MPVLPESIRFGLLMSRLGQEARTRPRMVRAMVELTYGCNLRCVHCYNPTHEARDELSTEQVCSILDGLAAQGCLYVGFTGGELFTRRDAFRIFRHAKSLGFVVSILTNATLITPERADRLKELDPYLVDISVYGATAETYERVTRVPGSFKKFARGVDLLLEREVPMILKIVLMSLNAHELEAMRDFASSRRVRFQVSTEIQPKADGSAEPLAYRLSPEQMFEAWKRVSGEALLKNKKEEEACGSAGRLFDCGCGKSSAAVTPHGKMNLCLSAHTPQFDLTAGSVEEGWKKMVALVEGAKAGPDYECGGCGLAGLCARSTLHGWLEHGRFDGPCIPRYQEAARLRADFLKSGGV